MRIAFTTSTYPVKDAYAYQDVPQPPGTRAADIWVDLDRVGGSVAFGTVGYEAVLHEIGHVLGLKHPFEGTTLPDEYDQQMFTVMAYDQAVQLVTYWFNGYSYGYDVAPVETLTPMVADIVAVQATYGADTGTRTGDDVYTPIQGERGYRTIYDAGGEDWIDLTGFTRPNNVDLRPGAYSDIGIYTGLN